MDTHANNLLLASSSPRRRALLSQAGIDYEVVSPPLEEPAELNSLLAPAQLAEALAYFKARSVAERRDGCPVLGADTICAADGHILGKPADADEARWMLRKLSAAPHYVITGVAVLRDDPDHTRLIASDATRITMKPMTDRDVEDYIATGEWEGKAGAYAIQETADRYVTDVSGSFTNVVGLPVELVARMLRQVGIQPRTGAAR
jgi:septum formation protein